MKTADCIKDVKEVKDYEKKLKAMELQSLIIRDIKSKQEELDELKKDYNKFMGSNFDKLKIETEIGVCRLVSKKWSCGITKGGSYYTE